MNTVEPDIQKCRTLLISSLTYECLNHVPQCKYSLCVGLVCFCMHPYKSEFSTRSAASFSIIEH
ncbi:hypothetical protein GSbR_20410 [Geobacter sp. SVR]|nr:hypothetical protein GSVR_17400 [Geobacter sp. SVR]GCF85441.1 hypothetical protein GSbR_20410 [Geobacter sp. SVR]